MPNQRTIPRTCRTCGANFLAWSTVASRPAHGMFCSRRCVRWGKAEELLRSYLLNQAATSSSDNGCWPSPYGEIGPGGHARIKVAGQRVFVHKLAWLAGGGEPIPTDGRILHVCDNPPCIRNDSCGTYEVNGIECPRVGHLYLGTISINNTDKALKGRATRGVDYWSAKLTEDDVRAIRKAHANGARQAELARQYHMSASGMSSVLHHESWRHVE
jgi:hypothetical protein